MLLRHVSLLYCTYIKFLSLLVQFFEILVAINATIDALFEQFGVNATSLRRKAEVALSRANDAKDRKSVV